jgi:Na+-transporting methylmalonyl-CoA/oxaloacetate decarboxylase beta subunit
MTLRRGIYVVPTGRWYIERTVWMIAGLVLLGCTLLAVLVNPMWIFGVIATGLVSINVAFTGFCPIGNVLYRLGFKPMLARNPSGRWYFLQTDSWYLERRIYVTVGVNIILGSILFLTFSPWWALFTGFVGTAMVWFAATGLCILANILYWIGAEPRLNPGILTAGRAKVPAAARVSGGEKHA